MQEPGLGMMGHGGGGIGGLSGEVSLSSSDEHHHLKAEIATHPLYEQLLAAHIACLRVATPIDQLPLIEAQLSQSHHVLRSYASFHHQNNISLSPHERQELDNFLAQYMMVLCSFKEQLQQHVRVHAVEAVMACREIESTLQALTGVTLGEGTGATMSDDEDDLQMDFSLDQSGADGHDMMGFGPLLPTESERSLMERVRQELKIELKQGFKSKIEDVREEILRKRRAGKLPGDTTSVLKNWWQQHSKWPYPTYAMFTGRRQGKTRGGNRPAAKANQQLVHQPEEAQLAQQLSICYRLEIQAQAVEKSIEKYGNILCVDS